MTIDGVSRSLSETFFVIATQNPIDSHGAYPLPEAQLDRFAMKLEIGYPDRAAQLAILNQSKSRDQASPDSPLSIHTLRDLQRVVDQCRITTELQEYLVTLCEATRTHEGVRLGVSPRGMLIWQQVAKAWAVLQGRDFVVPDDIQSVAHPVLGVRLITRGQPVASIIDSILQESKVPDYR